MRPIRSLFSSATLSCLPDTDLSTPVSDSSMGFEAAGREATPVVPSPHGSGSDNPYSTAVERGGSAAIETR